MPAADLTAAQERALAALVADYRAAEKPEHWRMSPRGLARMLWPDSPAWERRTRKHGSNDPGAMGGTMPMLGARMLWALQKRGYVSQVEWRTANLWVLTAKGRAR